MYPGEQLRIQKLPADGKGAGPAFQLCWRLNSGKSGPSGGGGGGSTAYTSGGGLGILNGSNGANTTVSNSTLSISITATGGRFGEYTTGGTMQGIISGSTGGDVLNAQGAAGGRSRAGAGGNFTYDGPPDNGMAGNVVQKYVTGSNVGGQSLTISYGAGGAAGSGASIAGENGYVEITVW